MCHVQVVVSKDAPGFEAALNCGGVGASVSITGEVVASKGKGQEVEIKADEVEVGQNRKDEGGYTRKLLLATMISKMPSVKCPPRTSRAR